ncbi:MAG: LPS-assembly protein LptD, partial [Bdellovibrionales bacterium]|nr:LPS-assembly protein LptD [Bdellovibrionales bacterium]
NSADTNNKFLKSKILKSQLQRLDLNLKKDLLINSFNFKYKLKEKKIYTKGKTHIIIGDYQFKSVSSTINLKNKELIFKNGVKLTSHKFSVKCKILYFQLKNKNWRCYNADFKTERHHFVGTKIFKKGVKYQIDDASFTSCKTCPKSSPDWSMYSKKILIKNGRSFINVPTIKIKNVPIIALPYLSIPFNTKRASGLLIPKISFSERWGWSYSQSFFIPFNINNDLSINETIYSKNIIKSGLEYRHIFEKNKYLNFYASHLWNKDQDINYAALAYSHYFEYKKNWTQRLSLKFISDSQYLQDFNNEREYILKEYGEASLTNKISLTKNFQKESSIHHFNIEGVLYQNILNTADSFKKNLTHSLPNIQYSLLTNKNLLKYISTNLNINFNNFNTNNKGFIAGKLVDDQRLIDDDLSHLFDPSTDIITSGKRLRIRPSIGLSFQPNNLIKTSLDLSYNQFLYSFNPKINQTTDSDYKNSAHQSYVNLNYFIKSNLYKIFSYNKNKYKHNIEPSLEVSYIPIILKSKHNFFKSKNKNAKKTLNDNSFKNSDEVIQFDYFDNIEKNNKINFKLYSQLIKKNNSKYTKLLDFQISQAYTIIDKNTYEAENLLTEINLTVNRLGVLSKTGYGHKSKLLSTSNHIYWLSKNKKYKINLNYSNIFFTGTDKNASYDKQENLKLTSLLSTDNWGIEGSVDLFKKFNQDRQVQSWDYRVFYQPDNQCWKIGFQQKTKFEQDSSFHLNVKLNI